MRTERTGSCGCGKARYRLSGEPIYVNNCHCRQCQRQTGSTSVVNAFYEAPRFELTSGELVEDEFVAGSGGPHFVCRCAECGTALWSYYPRFGRLGAGVRVGTLDDPASLTPDAIIFVSEKMPWVPLPEGIRAFEKAYDPAQILPPERLARLTALIELREKGEGWANAAA